MLTDDMPAASSGSEVIEAKRIRPIQSSDSPFFAAIISAFRVSLGPAARMSRAQAPNSNH